MIVIMVISESLNSGSYCVSLQIYSVIACGVSSKITALMVYNAECSSSKLSEKSQCFMAEHNIRIRNIF